MIYLHMNEIYTFGQAQTETSFMNFLWKFKNIVYTHVYQIELKGC